MAKFCKYCGNPLDIKTGLCNNCNTAETLTENELALTESPENDISSEKTIAMKEKNGKKRTASPKDRRKNILIIILALVVAVVIIGGSVTVALVYFNVVDIPVISQLLDHITKSSIEEEYATEIVTAFKTDDIEKINDIIFSTERVVIDENIGVSFDDDTEEINDEEKDGIISEIFALVEISYKGIENNKFTYTVKSPDMSGVFDNISDFQSTNELSKHICNYAENAEIVRFDVNVDYVNNQGQIIAYYQTEEFINAITGGLADEYKKIYTQYINELLANEG